MMVAAVSATAVITALKLFLNTVISSSRFEKSGFGNHIDAGLNP